MKCPKCGFENPEGAKFCCNCGGKLEELKACVNPQCPDYGKHILPLESCFCPTCGSSLAQTTNITSGETNKQEEENNDELHIFFPVAGITLGETSVKDVLEIEDNFNSIKFQDSQYNSINTYSPAGCTCIEYRTGVSFAKYPKDDYISELKIQNPAPMFHEWKQLGFDWNMSYEKWTDLFKNRGYRLFGENDSPNMINYNRLLLWDWEQVYWEIYIKAIAKDSSIEFKLTFRCNAASKDKNNYKLNQIKIYSKNSKSIYKY